jgi:hypothetical protein
MLAILLFAIYFVVFSILIFDFKSEAQLKWWVEVKTHYPVCTYYFGPFDSQQEAKAHHADYLNDLYAEGAQGIDYQIKRCQPQALTISDEDSELAIASQ